MPTLITDGRAGVPPEEKAAEDHGDDSDESGAEVSSEEEGEEIVAFSEREVEPTYVDEVLT